MRRKKTVLFLIFILIIVSTFCLPTASAADADYKKWHLPQGAKVRLGKGNISASGQHVVQFSPDGTRLAVASSIGIWLYETQRYQESALLTRPEGEVHSLCFSPDGGTLASGGWKKLYLWDVSTGTLQALIEDIGTGYITSLAFSPDGGTLATGSWGELYLWDVSTGTLRETFKYNLRVSSVSFSPDGRTLASSGIWEEGIYLWDVSTGTRRGIPREHSGPVQSVSFSPSGRTLASGGFGIHLWDASTGTLHKTFRGHDSPFEGIPVESISFSPNGQTLASADHAGNVHLWDVSIGGLRKTLSGHNAPVESISFSPNGQTLASADHAGNVHLWDVSTGGLRKTLSGHNPAFAAVKCVSFSPDGQTLASGNGSDIHLWDVSTATLRKTLRGHDAQVESISFSPDGRMLASGDAGGSLRGEDTDSIHLWDVSTGTLLKTFTSGRSYRIQSLSFSPDGRTLTTAGGGIIQLWDVSTGTLQKTIMGKTEYKTEYIIDTVTFSPDGQTVADGGYWSLLEELSDEETGIDWSDGNDESCHEIHEICYEDGFISLWDVSTGTPQIFIEDICGRVTGLAFSPDGQMLASCSGGEVHLRDISTGTLRKSLTNSIISLSLAFSPDGRTLATGSLNELHLWDVSTGTLHKTLIGHTKILKSYPLSIVFSPDGRMLATGSGDGTVILWDPVLIMDSFVEPPALRMPMPTETALLQNYPNPFNPETWIPYHLVEDTHVSLRIYSIDGTLIRTLMLCEYKDTGVYGSQDHAAYWDGKNDIGESVASGIYFYTLTAGDYTATRKMLIRK